jgi:hypothetical protein
MNSLFISFDVLCFHIRIYVVQPRLHLFGFGLLPHEGVWQLHLDGCFAKTSTWGIVDGT